MKLANIPPLLEKTRDYRAVCQQLIGQAACRGFFWGALMEGWRCRREQEKAQKALLSDFLPRKKEALAGSFDAWRCVASPQSIISLC